MSENIETLSEACKIAGIVAGEEMSIVELEKQIADKFRAITKKIFTSAKFRLKKSKVMAEEQIDVVYRDIVTVYHNGVFFDDDFHGDIDTLRITPAGAIVRIKEHIYNCQSYDLTEMEEINLNPYETIYRSANDHEIATCAVHLAGDLIAALKTRIDTSKTEKDELRRIAGKI